MLVWKKNSTSLTPYLKKNHNKFDDVPQETGFEVSVYSDRSLESMSKDLRRPIFNKFCGWTEEKEENGKKVSIHHKGLSMDSDLVVDMAVIMIKRGWTEKRLIDAYEYVLSNHVWNTPVMPAEILSYDRNIKFNTYDEISLRINQYVSIYYDGINAPVYITKKEQAEFNFPEWKEEYRKKPRLTEQEQIDMCIKHDERIRKG